MNALLTAASGAPKTWWTVAAYMIVAAFLPAALGCRKSSNKAVHTEGVERKLNCKYTGKTRAVKCQPSDAAACRSLPTEVLCRSEYLDVLQGRVNNWKKQGVWTGYVHKVTWFDLPSGGELTDHNGKKCLKASLDADIWLCPTQGATAPSHVGYGRMLGYEQNMITDDLEIEVLESFDEAGAKQERGFRELLKAGSDRSAIDGWLASTGSGLDPGAVANELLVIGVSASELMAAATSRRQQQQTVEKAAKEAADRHEQAAAPLVYPARCRDVDTKTHVPVLGDAELCVPQGQGVLVASLLAGKNGAISHLPPLPSSYDDEDPVAVMLGPDTSLGEAAKLSAGERAGIAAKTRGRVFAELKSTASWGEWSWVESAGKLSGVIDLGNFRLTEGEPSVQRKQRCETMPGMACGRCTDNRDCNPMFSVCGCPQSRCNLLFHVCSGCPGESHCDAPEFPLTVPKKTFAALFSNPADRARAKRASEGAHGILLTRITGAWRRTFTTMEKAVPDEESKKKVEFDSGYYARIAPLGFFVLACEDVRCGRTAEQLVVFNATPWDVTIGESPKVEIRCQNGICKGKVVK